MVLNVAVLSHEQLIRALRLEEGVKEDLSVLSENDVTNQGGVRGEIARVQLGRLRVKGQKTGVWLIGLQRERSSRYFLSIVVEQFGDVFVSLSYFVQD